MNAKTYAKLLSPKERQQIASNASMPDDLRAACAALGNAPAEQPRQRAQKIASHAPWYRGRWERDTCTCGGAMLVPAGKKSRYRCNDCADRAEGLGD